MIRLVSSLIMIYFCIYMYMLRFPVSLWKLLADVHKIKFLWKQGLEVNSKVSKTLQKPFSSRCRVVGLVRVWETAQNTYDLFISNCCSIFLLLNPPPPQIVLPKINIPRPPPPTTLLLMCPFHSLSLSHWRAHVMSLKSFHTFELVMSRP